MNEETLRRHIVEALVEVVPEAETVTLAPDRSFRGQVEMDSVDFLRYVLALEARLGVRIPESDYPRLSSVDGSADYLSQRLTEPEKSLQ